MDKARSLLSFCFVFEKGDKWSFELLKFQVKSQHDVDVDAVSSSLLNPMSRLVNIFGHSTLKNI